MITQLETDTTGEGYKWTPQDGISQGGMKCEGTVSPLSNLNDDQDELRDVVIIGAGYAGLSAARDLVTAGESKAPRSSLWCLDVPRALN